MLRIANGAFIYSQPAPMPVVVACTVENEDMTIT